VAGAPRRNATWSAGLALGLVVARGVSGCTAKHDAEPDAAVEPTPVDAAQDATDEVAVQVADAGPGNPTSIAAMSQTSILDGPWWPETGKGTKRLGYLRHGAVVAAYDRAIPNDDCKEGWYELVGGGFACGKAVTAELTSPRVRLAPRQPDRDAGMPYRYGVNLSDGTPLYRRVLAAEERKKHEPWLAPPKVDDDVDKTETKSDRSEAKADKAEAKADERAEATEETESPTRKAESTRSGPADAGADAGRPKLKELKGRGVLVRRMARGFYLALDKEFRAAGARWWRTSFGFAVPFERIMLQQSQTKHLGSWFDGADLEGALGLASAPGGDGDGGSVAAIDAAADGAVTVTGAIVPSSEGDAGAPSIPWVVGFVNVGAARRIELSDEVEDKDGKKTRKVSWGAELPRRASVMLTGREATASGQKYHQAVGGFWVRMADLKLGKPAPPADLRPSEKWIDVDLTRQALIAFEGTRPVFATLISSGRRNPQDKEKDFPTPTGTFHVREKHVTTTMDGDVASDGPYSIEDVPWVMYFQGSYATHGAFWHDAFGRMRSHGCVNMAPDDARTLFAWADPQLPPGWHGVFAKDEASGTRIVVHEDAPERRR